MKWLGVFLIPLDGVLVHRKFTGTHLYTWVERGTVRVKCLAQEHNTMSPARAWTWTARSGDECTNHVATLSYPGSLYELTHHVEGDIPSNCFFYFADRFHLT